MKLKIPPPLKEDIFEIEYIQSRAGILNRGLKSMLLRLITSSGSHLFLRGRDLISVGPMISGVHEPGIKSLIDTLAGGCYGDFLLDVGANIGLISCQSGNLFKTVHMFEPNPLCCKVLEVNSIIALEAGRYHIHQYGLGENAGRVSLTIPKHNWAGAFVRDDVNSYSDKLLADKDGYKEINPDNYFDVEIDIQEAHSTFKKIFSELTESNLNQGVIKIDVEGYEPTILHGIASSIPKDVKAVVIFESWDPNFAVESILDKFKGRAVAYKYKFISPWNPRWPRFFKALSTLFPKKISYKVSLNPSGDWAGDIIFVIN